MACSSGIKMENGSERLRSHFTSRPPIPPNLSPELSRFRRISSPLLSKGALSSIIRSNGKEKQAICVSWSRTKPRAPPDRYEFRSPGNNRLQWGGSPACQVGHFLEQPCRQFPRMRRSEAPQPAPTQVGLQSLGELVRTQQLQQLGALIPFAIVPAGDAQIDLVRQTKVRAEAL